ncbi:MAG: EAL domain-containing protein [Oscillospiraceae bacterium]|nr:EAL domain-containing protein [Oscillospiraceae bacterium]
MKEISYHIAGLLMLAIISICYSLNKKTPLLHNKCYLVFVLSIAMTTAAAIFTDGITDHIGINTVKYISYMVYFITHVMCTPTALLYVMSLRRELGDFNTRERIMLFAPFIFIEILVFTNPLTNLIFSVEDMVYTREKGMIFIYVIAFYYMICIVAYTLVHRKHYSRSVIVAITALVGIMVAAAAVQFFFPTQKVENFALSLCALAVLLVIQNPVSVIDTEYDIYNKNSLVSMLKYDFERKKKFYIMTIVINDFEHYSKSLGNDFITNAIKQITKVLFEIGAQKIYSVSPGVISVEFPSFSEINRKVSRLCEIFDRPWYCGTRSAMLPIRICVVECPEDVNDTTTLINIISWFENNKESEKILYFSEVDNKNLMRASAIKSAVKKVVETGEFGISYRPVYSFDEDNISYVESELYITDDVIGIISDAEFSAVAERSGDMAKIGEAAFEKICRFINAGGLEDNGLQYIEVPFSVVQCVQNNMAERYLSVLEKYGIEPSKICFKISEIVTDELSIIIEDYLNDLHEKGFLFCFNNFGAGKSEISSIYNLPFSYVKIADSVISAALSNGKAAIMLESTLSLMMELGIKTIAGGVDGENSFRMLSNMNCQYAEGDFISGSFDKKSLSDYIKSFESPMVKGGVTE